MNIPGNWQMVSQNETSFWFSPGGGYFRRQNNTYFRYGVNAGIRSVQINDLMAESKTFYQTIFQAGNNYLDEQHPVKEIIVNDRKGMVATFAGFGLQDQEEEIVTVYTFFTAQGNLFYIITVSPFYKRADYQSAFRKILNSARF